MAPRHNADLFHIGLDVMSTALSSATGFITAQLGDVVARVVKSQDAEWYFPPGVVGRVRAPDPGTGAAQVVAITKSDHDAIVGCRDARVKAIYGSLEDGETAIFASAENGGIVTFKADGSIVAKAGDGLASATIKPGGEVDIFGTTVKIGDSSAAPVTKASWATSLETALATLATSLGAASTFPQVQAAGSALGIALAALGSPATTKGSMT